MNFVFEKRQKELRIKIVQEMHDVNEKLKIQNKTIEGLNDSVRFLNLQFEIIKNNNATIKKEMKLLEIDNVKLVAKVEK